jgi:hypothetical protein
MGGKLSVPAENQGVVKGEAGEATKPQSKYTKQESAHASLPGCDYHPAVFTGKNPRALKTEGALATIV